MTASRTAAEHGVVVVGAGDMGTRHARAWAAAGARIVAVVDPDPERARALADRYDARTATGADDAFALPAATVASVCTPTHRHAPVTIAALRAGLHVLCEKPPALVPSDVAAMAEAERTAGRSVRIGFVRRFDPIWRHVEDARRRLGGPLSAQATLVAGIRPKHGMHDVGVNGGPVIDMACHLFDRWERLFGRPPRTVTASGHVLARGKPEVAGVADLAIDTVQAVLDYGEAGAAQLQLAWGLPAGVPALERHVYVGPDGTVATDGRTVRHWSGAEPSAFGPSATDPWEAQVAAFARELAGEGPQGLADLADGMRALRTSWMVLEAVASRRPVAWPAEPEPAGATCDAREEGT